MSAATMELPRPPPPPRPLASVLLGAQAARRRFAVRLAKRLLPLVALALLSLVALWPELSQDMAGHVSDAPKGMEVQSGQLTQARYNGVDDRGRPYTMTATEARQIDPDHINLTTPKADLSPQQTPQGGAGQGGAGQGTSGAWLMLQADHGVYAPHESQLDLWGNVVLYRDDGVTLISDAATVDLHSGVVTSPERTHVEGPFGTLDAQGFTVTDRGFSANFTGPGRLVLNGRQP